VQDYAGKILLQMGGRIGEVYGNLKIGVFRHPQKSLMWEIWTFRYFGPGCRFFGPSGKVGSIASAVGHVWRR
jgi:hypothetical protein